MFIIDFLYVREHLLYANFYYTEAFEDHVGRFIIIKWILSSLCMSDLDTVNAGVWGNERLPVRNLLFH